MNKIKTGAYNPILVAPVVLVGADVDGKANYMTAAFVNGVNINPPVLYISLNKKHHTARGIIENGCFSINVPPAGFVVETDYCGLVSGRNVDKSKVFTSFYGELGHAPMIEAFPITCECRYSGQKVEFAMDVVYFGEVVQVYVNEDVIGENKKIDMLKVNPLCFTGVDNQYRALGAALGSGWSIGKQYKTQQKQTTGEYAFEIKERAFQETLSIRSRVSPVEVERTIGQSAGAVYQYALEKGWTPSGALFVAYHGFDGQSLDIETGFPFNPGIEGRDPIVTGKIPGGKTACYRHLGPYDKLPEIRSAMGLWLTNQGYQAGGPAYDFYLNDPKIVSPADLETEVIIPVVNRS